MDNVMNVESYLEIGGLAKTEKDLGFTHWIIGAVKVELPSSLMFEKIVFVYNEDKQRATPDSD